MLTERGVLHICSYVGTDPRHVSTKILCVTTCALWVTLVKRWKRLSATDTLGNQISCEGINSVLSLSESVHSPPVIPVLPGLVGPAFNSVAPSYNFLFENYLWKKLFHSKIEQVVHFSGKSWLSPSRPLCPRCLAGATEEASFVTLSLELCCETCLHTRDATESF